MTNFRNSFDIDLSAKRFPYLLSVRRRFKAYLTWLRPTYKLTIYYNRRRRDQAQPAVVADLLQPQCKFLPRAPLPLSHAESRF